MLLILFACATEPEDNLDDSFQFVEIENLMESAVLNIDTNATVKVEHRLKSDSIIVTVTNIIIVDETLEFAELFRDYLLAKVFIQNHQEIPAKILFNIQFKRGFDYSFNGTLLPHHQNHLANIKLTEYIEYLLVNITYMDAAYFNLRTSFTKEFYQKYDYHGTLLSLLLDFYFLHHEKEFETWMALFYLYSDIPYDDDVLFNKSILDSSLNYIGYNSDKWTSEYVNELYMDTYNVDTIYTPKNEVLYYRGIKN